MSTTTLPAPIAQSAAVSGTERHVELQDQLHLRVVRAIATGEEFGDIPNDCELWLLPDDNPEHVEWVFRAAAEAVIPGRNVYLRWVHPDNLPAVSIEWKAPEVVRRVEYLPDGSIARVSVPDGDEWREVEPTPGDLAGLPPT